MSVPTNHLGSLIARASQAVRNVPGEALSLVRALTHIRQLWVTILRRRNCYVIRKGIGDWSGRGGRVGFSPHTEPGRIRRVRRQAVAVEPVSLGRPSSTRAPPFSKAHSHSIWTPAFKAASGPGLDIWWDQQTTVARQMVPQGTARIVNVGSVDFNGLTADALQMADLRHDAHQRQQQRQQQARHRRRLRRSDQSGQLLESQGRELRLRHDDSVGHLQAGSGVCGARDRLQPAGGREGERRRRAPLRHGAQRRPRESDRAELQPGVGGGRDRGHDRAAADVSRRGRITQPTSSSTPRRVSSGRSTSTPAPKPPSSRISTIPSASCSARTCSSRMSASRPPDPISAASAASS